MRLKRVLARFTVSEDCAELRQVARDLGRELPKNNIELLSEFRSEAVRLRNNNNDFVKGYQTALLDLCAAYEAAIQPEQDLKLMKEFLIKNKNHLTILKLLDNGPYHLVELISKTQINPTVAENILNELIMLRAVEQLTTNKIYRTTLFGEKILASFKHQVDVWEVPDKDAM